MTLTNKNPTLGEFLRAARLKTGLSIRQLARRVSIAHSYIVKLETGQKTKPNAEYLYRLAEALELDPTELLRFIGISPPSKLPSAPIYFRRKYGLDESDAAQLAQLVEEFTNERRKHHP